jgi:predicted ATPase
VPAVAQLLRSGLELGPGLTILVGENGSGKSTIVEMLAEAYGLNPQGGSIQAPAVRVRETEPGTGRLLTVERGAAARSAWAYFLRADTMHSLYTYLEENPGRRRERFHELSHGQGFLEILRTRVNQRGFYLMDEPDAPLSFVSCRSLVTLLHDLAEAGSQAVVATHSPIVASVPGARILELGEWGIRPAEWEDLEIVQSWRMFLANPGRFLRYLLTDEDLGCHFLSVRYARSTFYRLRPFSRPECPECEYLTDRKSGPWSQLIESGGLGGQAGGAGRG